MNLKVDINSPGQRAAGIGSFYGLVASKVSMIYSLDFLMSRIF